MMKVFFIMLLLPLTFGCSDSNQELLVDIQKVMKPVRKTKKLFTVINLDSLTNFEWDSVYFFSKEEGGEYVNKKIGFSWNGPSVPNLHTRLLFVKDTTVVTYVDFNSEELPYGSHAEETALPFYLYRCSKGNGISRSEARFVTSKICEYGYVVYPLIPLNCAFNNDNYKNMLKKKCD